MPKHRHTAAMREVTSKSEAQIDRETSLKWFERAKACFHRYRETGRKEWLLRAESYRHEALEHAALAGSKFVTVIERRLKKEGI